MLSEQNKEDHILMFNYRSSSMASEPILQTVIERVTN